MPLIAIALIIAAALGGGTAVAAQSSLPGDTLWGFKTTINENVAGAFAQSDEAKANWDISVATTRLDEAQKLAADGKLDANAQVAIKANFDTHAKDVAALIAKLQADGNATSAAAVATHFQAELASHASGVVEASANQKADIQASIAPFLSEVRGTLDEAANLSAKASADASEQEDGQASSTGSNEGSSDAGTSTSVHTTTSVRGQDGGIKTNSETGATVGI